MSTYTVIDAARILKEALTECWDENRRYQERRRQAQAEYDRRLAQIETELEERRRQAQKAYEEALAQMDVNRRQAMEEDSMQIRQCEERLASIRATSRRILEKLPELGNGFLADASRYHDDAELCVDILAAREEIRRDANGLLERSALLQSQEAQSVLEDVEKTAASLTERFKHLMMRLEKERATAFELSGQRESYDRLLRELADGTSEAVQSICVLPTDIQAARKEAKECLEAMRTIEYYLYGEGSMYLPKQSQEELRRLYGLHGDLLADMQSIAAREGNSLGRLNRQFRSAKKRDFDLLISRNRSRSQQLWESYLNMYEKLHGNLDGAMQPGAEGEQLLAELEAAVAAMRPKYLQRAQQDMLQEVVESALQKSRRGMRVRRVAADTTASGNCRTLYEIGESGTCVEVYTDARGQILIEAGGITEGESPSDAQMQTIARNNRYFCDHELPAILRAMEEEMRGAAIDISLQRQPEEDRIHTFDLEQYSVSEGNANIIARDGTLVRRRTQGSVAGHMAIDMEDTQ